MLNTIKRKIITLVKYILDGILFILLLPYTILALLIIRILAPFIIIRLGWIVSWRIGHYAGNLDMYLCEQSNNPVKTLDIWCERTVTCNTQLTIVFKRVINIFPKFFSSYLRYDCIVDVVCLYLAPVPPHSEMIGYLRLRVLNSTIVCF